MVLRFEVRKLLKETREVIFPHLGSSRSGDLSSSSRRLPNLGTLFPGSPSYDALSFTCQMAVGTNRCSTICSTCLRSGLPTKVESPEARFSLYYVCVTYYKITGVSISFTQSSVLRFEGMGGSRQHIRGLARLITSCRHSQHDLRFDRRIRLGHILGVRITLDWSGLYFVLPTGHSSSHLRRSTNLHQTLGTGGMPFLCLDHSVSKVSPSTPGFASSSPIKRGAR